MAEHPDPHTMSQRELDEYLDDLVEHGRDDTPEFHLAYAEWERREG
jgi:hypothetical protein